MESDKASEESRKVRSFGLGCMADQGFRPKEKKARNRVKILSWFGL